MDEHAELGLVPPTHAPLAVGPRFGALRRRRACTRLRRLSTDDLTHVGQT